MVNFKPALMELFSPALVEIFSPALTPSEFDELQEKKNSLKQEYSSSESTMDELYKIRKNYGIYMGKEMER